MKVDLDEIRAELERSKALMQWKEDVFDPTQNPAKDASKDAEADLDPTLEPENKDLQKIKETPQKNDVEIIGVTKVEPSVSENVSPTKSSPDCGNIDELEDKKDMSPQKINQPGKTKRKMTLMAQ